MNRLPFLELYLELKQIDKDLARAEHEMDAAECEELMERRSQIVIWELPS